MQKLDEMTRCQRFLELNGFKIIDDDYLGTIVYSNNNVKVELISAGNEMIFTDKTCNSFHIHIRGIEYYALIGVLIENSLIGINYQSIGE